MNFCLVGRSGHSSLEPAIVHMKADGMLGKLAGGRTTDSVTHYMQCCVGYTLRMILRAIRLFLRPVFCKSAAIVDRRNATSITYTQFNHLKTD